MSYATERELQQLRNDLADVQNTLAFAKQRVNGVLSAMCLCCKDTHILVQGKVAFPICTVCMDSLGRITQTKKHWIFKE